MPLSNAVKDVEMSEPKHLEDLRFLTKYLSGFVLRSDSSLKLGIATITSSVDLQVPNGLESLHYTLYKFSV